MYGARGYSTLDLWKYVFMVKKLIPHTKSEKATRTKMFGNSGQEYKSAEGKNVSRKLLVISTYLLLWM